MSKMPSGERFQKAVDLLREAYRRQMSGDLDGAVDYYQQSIALHPTAEAHTFLGWTYSFQGNLDAAISECKEAIAVDPEFGNPYNDIGSYLIKLGRLDEAIPLLQAGLEAPAAAPRAHTHFQPRQGYRGKGAGAEATQGVAHGRQ